MRSGLALAAPALILSAITLSCYSEDGKSANNPGRPDSEHDRRPSGTVSCLEHVGPSFPSAAFCIAIAPDTVTIALGFQKEIWVGSVVNNIHYFGSHEAVISAECFSPNGQTLATGDDAGNVKVWNLSDPSSPKALNAHRSGISQVHFTTDGKWLLTLGTDGAACVWDTKTWRNERQIDCHKVPPAFSPELGLLAIASDEKDVAVIDIRTGNVTREIKGFSGTIKSIWMTCKGERVLVLDVTSKVSEASSVDSWKPRLIDLKIPDIISVSVDLNGRIRILGVDAKGMICIWGLTNDSQRTSVISLQLTVHDVSAVCFSIDAHMIYTVCLDQKLYILDLLKIEDPNSQALDRP